MRRLILVLNRDFLYHINDVKSGGRYENPFKFFNYSLYTRI